MFIDFRIFSNIFLWNDMESYAVICLHTIRMSYQMPAYASICRRKPRDWLFVKPQFVAGRDPGQRLSPSQLALAILATARSQTHQISKHIW